MKIIKRCDQIDDLSHLRDFDLSSFKQSQICNSNIEIRVGLAQYTTHVLRVFYVRCFSYYAFPDNIELQKATAGTEAMSVVNYVNE